MINFRSDNNARVERHILDALLAEAGKTGNSYGRDDVTERLDAAWSAVFETAVHIIPTVSGTAANALCLATLTPSYGSVLCHTTAHIAQDEVNAPGFFSPGMTLTPIHGSEGKIQAKSLRAALEESPWGSLNCSQPATVSLTQATEWGTVYSLTELREVADIAGKYGLRIHMDGARLANAIVKLDCTPAAATWKNGVEILSLGATKNGCMLAEAVVVFGDQDITPLRYKAKQSGQVAAKQRFISAQLLAYCFDGLWLDLASRANQAAKRLADGLSAISVVQLLLPPQANIVLVALPEEVIRGLTEREFAFHRWNLEGAVRFVTSFDTSDDDIVALLDAIKALA